MLEIGSRVDPTGGPDLPPIEQIDFVAKWFKRDGGYRQPWPDKIIKYRDIAFTPMRTGV